MEKFDVYVVRKKVFLDDNFKKQEIIAICDNKLDVFNHLVSGIVSLNGYYVVDYENKLKDRICFEKVKECGCLAGPKEVVAFSVVPVKLNERFCTYLYCDMSVLQEYMAKLEIFKA